VYALFPPSSLEEGAVFNQRVIGTVCMGAENSQIDALAKAIGTVSGQKAVRIIRWSGRPAKMRLRRT
jgi:hypothetical protein